MLRWKVFCNLNLELKPDALKKLEEIADIDYFPADQKILFDKISDYDAYLASAAVKIDYEILDQAKRLKVIATPSTGTDHIDRDTACAKGIDIIDIAKEYDLLNSFTATAEMAWALLLACIRGLAPAIDDAKSGKWSRQKFTGVQLAEKTLGILGFGRLGKMVAEYGKAFGMRVIACDLKEFSREGVEKVDFDTLLKDADVLSLHIHLNKDNQDLINRNAISKMKDGVVIVNTSRGGIIDEAALLDGLRSKKVKAAGLDIVCGEWDNDLNNHPLIKYARDNHNLVITPHIAGSTIESIIGARVFIGNKLTEYIKEKEK